MTAMESMYFFVKFQIRRHIRLHRRHCKNSNNLRNNSLFSERYIISNEIVMGNYKWWFKKQLSLSLFLSTSLTGHKRFEIWDFIPAKMTSLSLLLELGHKGWDFSGHRWFMRLSLARHSSGERSIRITVSTNQTFWNSVPIFIIITCVTSVRSKTWPSKSDTCFYNRVCKRLYFYPLYLHHPSHCCKTWWC